MGIIIAILIIWAILAVAGFLVEGLLWLAIIALVLFVVTAAWGAIRRRSDT